MADTTVPVLVGSLRAAAVNRQIAEWAAEVAPDGVAVTVYPNLGELPFYNEDIDTDDPPAPVAALRAIKNAIDWLSRPFGDSALQGKHPREIDDVVTGVREALGALAAEAR